MHRFFLFPHQYWFMNAATLTVDQRVSARTEGSSTRLRISGGSGLLFGPKQNSFLTEPIITRFHVWGQFLDISCQLFQIIIWENILLDHDRGLATGFLESSVFLMEKVVRWFPFGVQGVESGMPRKLHNSQSGQQKYSM